MWQLKQKQLFCQNNYTSEQIGTTMLLVTNDFHLNLLAMHFEWRHDDNLYI